MRRFAQSLESSLTEVVFNCPWFPVQIFCDIADLLELHIIPEDLKTYFNFDSCEACKRSPITNICSMNLLDTSLDIMNIGVDVYRRNRLASR